jgi:hypothetical protein
MNPLANGTKSAISSQKLMRRYLEDLAIEEHESALSSGSAEVFQWKAHPIRYNLLNYLSYFVNDSLESYYKFLLMIFTFP